MSDFDFQEVWVRVEREVGSTTLHAALASPDAVMVAVGAADTATDDDFAIARTRGAWWLCAYRDEPGIVHAWRIGEWDVPRKERGSDLIEAVGMQATREVSNGLRMLAGLYLDGWRAYGVPGTQAGRADPRGLLGRRGAA